ncbi:MAG: hypothetical protein AB8G11_26155 [Saprospiraceae bacterium]
MTNKLFILAICIILIGCQHSEYDKKFECGTQITWSFTKIKIGDKNLNTFGYGENMTIIDFFLIFELDKSLKGNILITDSHNSYVDTISVNFDSIDTSKKVYGSFFYLPVRELDEVDWSIEDLSDIKLYFVNKSDTCLIRKHDLYNFCIKTEKKKSDCTLPMFIDTLQRYLN